MKVKVIPIKSKQKKVAELLGRYFTILSEKEIKSNKLKRDVLQNLFTQIIRENNKIAQKDRYDNFFDFKKKNDKVPIVKFKKFLKGVDQLAININKEIRKPDKDFYKSCKKMKIPEDIYSVLGSKNPKFKEYIKQIKIKAISDYYPSARYDKKTNKVVISANKKANAGNIMDFVHELGHVVSILDLIQKNKDPLKKSRFWHESQALAFQYKYLAPLSPEFIHIWKRSVLGNFATTLFEYNIYNNSDQKFSNAYARAVNKCYLTKQKMNGDYIFYELLLKRPCSTIVQSVAQFDLLMAPPPAR